MTIGPFEVLSTIGEGSAATVYHARHQSLGRTVALKHLNCRLEPGKPDFERFRREAELIASVDSDRVAKLHSFELIDGRPLLEFEWLDGGSLERIMAEGPLAPGIALKMIRDVLLGLKALHGTGIVHHAIKPSNVLCDNDGRYKLTDARLTILDHGESSTLQAAAISYAAPERISQSASDVRADLYSAGMIAYRAMLGASGFHSAFPDLMPAAVFASKWLAWLNDSSKSATPLHQLRDGISVPASQFVARLMAKEPDLRFASAEAALLALQPLLTLPPPVEPRSAPSWDDVPVQTLIRPVPEPLPETLLRPAPSRPKEAARRKASGVDATTYFMTLVGGFAGLACWAATTSIADFLTLRQEGNWLLLTLWTTIMGALIGGMTVGFVDRWSADRLRLRWVVTGGMLGTAAGVVSGLLYVPIQLTVVAVGGVGIRDIVARTALWTMAGGLIGVVIGLRWYSVNPYRAIHAMVGGIVGGTLGGLVFHYTSATHEFFGALAFVLTGAGISLGVTLAPVLLRNGVLQFVTSGDEAAQRKYGPPKQEWPVQSGDRLIIGSEGAGEATTLYARNIHVFVPDTMVAPRHAILFERDKRFYIQVHPENAGQGGRPHCPLKAGNVSVVGTREISDGDDLLVGQTSFRFMTRRKTTGPGADEVSRSVIR